MRELIFGVVGVAIGAAGGFLAGKYIYEKRCEEEIQEMREYYRNKLDNIPEETVKIDGGAKVVKNSNELNDFDKKDRTDYTKFQKPDIEELAMEKGYIEKPENDRVPDEDEGVFEIIEHFESTTNEDESVEDLTYEVFSHLWKDDMGDVIGDDEVLELIGDEAMGRVIDGDQIAVRNHFTGVVYDVMMVYSEEATTLVKEVMPFD